MSGSGWAAFRTFLLLVGGVSARTNCVYANYVEARYPAASFVVTGPFDPVLVAVGPTVRAVIMPVK